ncbi:MAG: HAMP domain-containing sensor histidine kinase [Candidatus Pacebacteria bacterium]|nr:HAMP domain-containing sensor histidine kinase [Candidatus Paceibacterota bacterium]
MKRFGAWVTGLTDNYRFNPFTRATVHIITIMVILCWLLIAISGWAIQQAQSDTVNSIRYHLQEAVNGQPNSVATLPEAIELIRDRTLTYVLLGLLALIVLFGYLLIHFALTPTKNSLQLQKRFIGNVAHEIRTPLSIIKTSTEVSLMDPTLPASVRETLEGTVVELDRISEIINNLLSFDNLMQPGRMKTTTVDMEEVAQVVASRLQALAASRSIDIRVHVTGRHLVIGNQAALEQVVTNLVKNAIHYTREGNGAIRILVGNDYRGRVVVSIIDAGIGIAQKDLYHVFEPFYRGDTSRMRGIGTGTSGLGLAIVNEIVRLHKGAITIRSAVGQGTTVAVAFPPPRDEKAPTELPQAPSLQDIDEDTHEISLDFS